MLNITLVLAILVAAFPALQATFAHPLQIPHTAAIGHLAPDAPFATSMASHSSSGNGVGDTLPVASPQPSLSATVAVSATATNVISATATTTTSATATASATVSSSPTSTPSVSPTASATTTTTATDSVTASPTATAGATSVPAPTPSQADSAAVAAEYGQVPLQFEPNRGQADPQVAYLAHGPGYQVYLTATEAVLGLYAAPPQPQGPPLIPARYALPTSPLALTSLAPATPLTPSAVLHLGLVGANAQAAPVGQDQLPGIVNYFYGSDPSGWLTNLPTYGEVAYPNVYPGIDLVYHGR